MQSLKPWDENDQIIMCFCLGALKTLYVDEKYAHNVQILEEEGEFPKLNEKPLRNQEDEYSVPESETRDKKHNHLGPSVSLMEYLKRNSNEYQTNVQFLDSWSYEQKISKEKKTNLNYMRQDDMCFREGSTWFIFPCNGKNMFAKFKSEDYYKLWSNTLESPRSRDMDSNTVDPEIQIIRVPQNDNSRIFKFFVFGKTGVGKSTFLNRFFKNNSPFETGSITRAEGVTKRIISQTGTFLGHHFKVYDSPGFGDLTINVSNWVLQFLLSRVLWEKLDKLFFVLRADYRLDQFEILMLRLVSEFVSSSTRNPSNNIVLIFTHCDKLDEKQQENFNKKTEEKLAKINSYLNKSWKICNYYCSSNSDYQTTINKIFSDSEPLQKDERLILKIPNLPTIKSIVNEALGIPQPEERASIKLKTEQDDGHHTSNCANCSRGQ